MALILQNKLKFYFFFTQNIFLLIIRLKCSNVPLENVMIYIIR